MSVFRFSCQRGKNPSLWGTKLLRKATIKRRAKLNEKSVYEIVTEKIIEQLEQGAGAVPWRKPWINGGAVS